MLGLVKDFRITCFDGPIGVFLPDDHQDWEVVQVSTRDLKDRKGSEVHKFRHWTVPEVFVRIVPPKKES